MKFVDALLTEDAVTENGMVTHSTAGNACVDLFFHIGAARDLSDDKVIALFAPALQEDALTALKILFYNRDIREGQGERKVFRTIAKYLADSHTDVLRLNVALIPEFGRWDDVLELFGTALESDALELIKAGLAADNALCAKWMPRKGPNANTIRSFLGVAPKTYRKKLVKLCKEGNVVEQKMCAKKWSKIDYNQVPSKAANQYRKAFGRNDKERYGEYLEGLEKGKTKVNAAAIFPHDIVRPYLGYSPGDDKLLNAQWKALPNYLEGNDKGIIPVCDVSGSMSGTPMEVSVSLGLYISERNVGAFQNAFITFSSSPKVQFISGKTLHDRVLQLARADWAQNTNLEKTFAMLLKHAVDNKVKAKDMPGTILILSDMQFDQCSKEPTNTAMDMIEREYADAGYRCPNVVFWNLRAVADQAPVKFTKKGTALVSGFSPSILKSILANKGLTPLSIMEETINKERYSKVVVETPVKARKAKRK